MTSDAWTRITSAAGGASPGGKYRHWDNLRQLTPPSGLTSEEWWWGVKVARRSMMRQLPQPDTNGLPLVYSIPDEALELLHYVDQYAAGNIAMPEVILEDAAAKRHYLVNSLIEEAIRSSQLEGATTTRGVAKEMILSGRPPRDRSEQMILNNYQALEFMRSEIGGTLTPESVLRLHRILTEGTLDNPDAAGRLQTPDDERVVVTDRLRGEIVHIPPAAEELPGRLVAMCEFANGRGPSEGFLHPVCRAILLHFWLAYDHPFEDGNGRTARAIFYWSMRTQGYWLTEYLSISKILRRAPGQYARAFMETETDEGDATYFILFNLGVIKRAIEDLHVYLRRKTSEIRDFERSISAADRFNHRQLALLKNAVRHADRRYTFSSHARSHKVTHQTARNDLLDLVTRGLLTRRRVGREFHFAPSPDLASLLTATA